MLTALSLMLNVAIIHSPKGFKLARVPLKPRQVQMLCVTCFLSSNF